MSLILFFYRMKLFSGWDWMEMESVWHFIRLRCASDRKAVSIPIWLWRRGCRRWSMPMINLHLKWRWDNDQFRVMPNSIYKNLLNIDSWLPSGHKFRINDGVSASDVDCILFEVNILLWSLISLKTFTYVYIHECVGADTRLELILSSGPRLSSNYTKA